MVSVICDGSCLRNPGPGGWAFALLKEDSVMIHYGFAAHTTNNSMELTAALEALKRIKNIKKIYTDSKYLVNGVREWMSNWKMRGWLTASKKPVLNLELWKEIDAVKNDVEIVWIPGHAKYKNFSDPEERFRIWVQNEVDLVARTAAEKASEGIEELNLDRYLA